jgi:hypothetical protein
MTIETLMAGCALIGSAISILTVLYFMTTKFARLELQVETMWAFQMRRAFSEVVTSGIGTVNSPLMFTEEAKRFLEPIKNELVAMWENGELSKRTDGETLLEIERVFGNRLLTMVCVPCGLSHGACLLLALSIAKGGGPLETDLWGTDGVAA